MVAVEEEDLLKEEEDLGRLEGLGGGGGASGRDVVLEEEEGREGS